MKCGKIKHKFEGNNAKCVCGRTNKWWFVCIRCKTINTAKIRGIACDECQKDPNYLQELQNFNKNIEAIGNIKHYREATAFVVDKKTGQPFALDKKGKKFDPKETRYDLDRDPHGWKATNKIPKKRKYYI